MDEEIKTTIILIISAIVLILLSVGTAKDYTNNTADYNAVQFIYEQCINETRIQTTYTSGSFTIEYHNDTQECVIKNGHR